ncbi:MAG: PEP-CTERM sorting domain-containing protein [Methylomonas sp.]|nr:PEP-CTERM sorting domain-containing protein [Methylomonas sp.]PPD19420.1 MAG: hypothetical protein CTY23_11880 [Methylomonas sp.]PPD25337.1 MAG: hypothetical protein CTY22_09130 [Methylomonas sp.]PPD35302.1 MAG: hypothetical protein CTY21_09130 [Methylomonas sp.]PPD51426.1 MAG: hypothetical protein CTY11_12170 [Methylomonas sp.]
MNFSYRSLQSITLRSLVTVGLATALTNTHAASLVDNFDDFQYVLSTSQPASGPLVIGSSLPGTVTRTMSITSTGQNDSGEMFSEAGILSISSVQSTSTSASVIYQFDGIDFAGFADAWLIDVTGIDLGATFRLIANDTSEFQFDPISQTGRYIALFSAFSNPGVFGQLNRFELRVSTSNDTDLTLSALSADRTHGSVPEPGTLALLLTGLLLATKLNIKPSRT